MYETRDINLASYIMTYMPCQGLRKVNEDSFTFQFSDDGQCAGFELMYFNSNQVPLHEVHLLTVNNNKKYLQSLVMREKANKNYG